MALWNRHRRECRGAGSIMDDARQGKLPGVQPDARGVSFVVTDENAALAAMRKEAA